MNIVVCIKQVPGTSKVSVDEKTGVLQRDGVEGKLNPYDLYAIETGVRIKEQHGGQVIVITMGPPQAEAIIREAFMMGADAGCLISDRRFAGSDVLATSYTLSQAIKVSCGFDLIICGRQTTDGDTAQVGAAIAEHLGIPMAAWVDRIDEIKEDAITVEQDLGDYIQRVQLGFPCLITVEKGIFQPRLPSYKRKLETQACPVQILSLNGLGDKDENHYGLKGSPTQVERIFPPEASTHRVLWEGLAEDLCCYAMGELKRLHLV